MKYLDNTASGGFPLYSDDPRFMTEISREALAMLTQPLANLHDVIIISGCNISTSGVNTTVSDGMVLFGNELMRFDAVTFPTPTGGDKAYWVVESVVLETRTFQNGVPNDIYKENVARIEVGSSVPSGSIEIGSTKTYWEVVNEKVIHPPFPNPPLAYDYEKIEDESFMSFISQQHDLINGFYTGGPNQKLIELDFKTNTNDLRLCSFGQNGLSGAGRKIYLRATTSLDGANTFRLLLNSTEAINNGFKRIIKGQGNASDTELQIIPGTVYTVIETSDNFYIYD